MDSVNKQLSVERPDLARPHEQNERELANKSNLSAQASRREREESIREALREGIRKFESQIDLLRQANSDTSAQLQSLELDTHNTQLFEDFGEDSAQIVGTFQGFLEDGDEERKQTNRPMRAEVGIIFRGSGERRLMFDQNSSEMSLVQQNLASTAKIQATHVHNLEVEQLEEWVRMIMLKAVAFLKPNRQSTGK
ncbi:hypothetical protein V5O48_013857 [Marasmius crinis-equi]|uniref:Uncharacterized protein n=1 Tax=Marasmius crinis-equi TaxID=585013 RepID=A0ABR3EZ00_9AGAR